MHAPTQEPISPVKFVQATRALRIGKRMPSAVYIESSRITELPHLLLRALTLIPCGLVSDLCPDGANVIKFAHDKPVVTMLRYDDLRGDAFPTLRWSLTWNVCTGGHYRNTYGSNRPVLHRKELLFRDDDPDRPEWVAITLTCERLRLFDQPQRIGRENKWRRLLKRAGVRAVGNRLELING